MMNVVIFGLDAKRFHCALIRPTGTMDQKKEHANFIEKKNGAKMANQE
jgi:hypothetical protein